MEMDLQYYRKIKIAIEIYSHYHIQTLKSKNGTIWKKPLKTLPLPKLAKRHFIYHTVNQISCRYI